MNLDLNISRTFRITERVALDFAAMATNALNHNEPGNEIASGFAFNSIGLGGVNVVPASASNNFAHSRVPPTPPYRRRSWALGDRHGVRRED